MEPSSSTIKNIPYILSKESFSQVFSKEKLSYISKNGILSFSSQTPKNLKKNNRNGFFQPKYFLIFPRMELSSSNIKKISHIFSKESLFYIAENGNLHFLIEVLKMKELHLKNPEKILYLIFFIRTSFHLNFFHNFLVKIFFIIRIFFHLNFFQLLHQNLRKFLHHQ